MSWFGLFFWKDFHCAFFSAVHAASLYFFIFGVWDVRCEREAFTGGRERERDLQR